MSGSWIEEMSEQALEYHRRMDEAFSPHGAPAFPSQVDVMGQKFLTLGMSIRDWFAGQALAGIMVSDRTLRGKETNEAVAAWAYEVADAMLAYRAGDKA